MGGDEKPWGKPAEGPTFNEKYPTEFRTSGVPDGGLGWWAKVDIPRNTRLRRVEVKHGSLIRVGSLEELKAAGWGVEDSVNYGIGHKKDSSAIYFLNPGTACNHADPTREVSIIYKHEEQDVFELWTVKDIKAGEEMFIHYSNAFGPCKWFDELHNAAGRTPLSQLGNVIDHSVMKLRPAAKDAVEMKVSLKKPKGFYVSAAKSFLTGVEAKPALEAKDGKPTKEAVEAKAAVNNLRISGTGDACGVAIAAATQIQTDKIGTITSIQTNYARITGSQCAQILIDVKKN